MDHDLNNLLPLWRNKPHRFTDETDRDLNHLSRSTNISPRPFFLKADLLGRAADLTPAITCGAISPTVSQIRRIDHLTETYLLVRSCYNYNGNVYWSNHLENRPSSVPAPRSTAADLVERASTGWALCGGRRSLAIYTSWNARENV